MRQMAARGMAMQNLSPEEPDGRDGRKYAVAPVGVTSLLARSDDGRRL